MYETAFVITLSENGVWEAYTTDLPLDTKRQATNSDVRIGCQEIARVINMADFGKMVLGDQPAPKPSDRVKEALRRYQESN